MPHAVIVAHGQPSDPETAEIALSEFARKVGAAAGDVSVHSATLAAPGRLEEVLTTLPNDTVIYPLFMAKGWFVTGALPKRLGERPLRILDPLGIDPALPELVAQTLREELDRLRWDSVETALVIAAHGSGRSKNPSSVTREFAAALSHYLEFKSARIGFVEEAPSISEAAQDTGPKTLCLPFFACAGGHVSEDVPNELQRADFSGVVLPTLSELPQIPKHIATQLSRHFGCSDHS